MAINSPQNTSIFTSRELRRLRTFRRSRDLSNTREVLKPNQPATQTQAQTTTFIVYGSGDALSPKQRSALRQQITHLFTSQIQKSAADTDKTTNPRNLRLSLFPNQLSQQQNTFSNLSRIRSLQQGSTFERVVTVFSGDEIFERQNLFNRIIQFRGEDSKPFPVKPALMFVPTFSGAISPRRVSHFISLSQKPGYDFGPAQKLIPYAKNKFNYITVIQRLNHTGLTILRMLNWINRKDKKIEVSTNNLCNPLFFIIYF